MPYIQDGRVVEKRSWSVERVIGLFWALVNFFWIFIQTILGRDVNRLGSSYTRDYRGGGGPPKPPSNKRITGFKPPTTAPGGGCAGGNCGR